MAKSQNKTTETRASVETFIKAIADAQKREDSYKLIEIFQDQTGFEAKMWGSSIVGFGSYHYTYESGREGDAPLVGFSPRKDAFSLYISAYDGREKLLETFGKHKVAKGCIYIKKVEDINPAVLKKMIAGGVKQLKNLYK